MKKTFFKRYGISIIGLSIFAILFILGLVQNSNHERNIQDNLHITIARIDNVIIKRSTGSIYYTYYYQNKEFESSENPRMSNRMALIGKYYEVRVSTKKPSISRVSFDREVKEKSRIRKAGFKIN